MSSKLIFVLNSINIRLAVSIFFLQYHMFQYSLNHKNLLLLCSYLFSIDLSFHLILRENQMKILFF